MHKLFSIKIQRFLGDCYPEKFERELSWFMYLGLCKHVVVTVNNRADVLCKNVAYLDYMKDSCIYQKLKRKV